MTNGEPTTADMIGQYVKLRDHIDAMTKEFEASLTPYREAMQALDGAVTEEILRLDGQSIKTEQGTAYRSTTLSARCADREAFFDFVFDGRKEGFLTSAVSKDAVKEYLEMHPGEVVPGIDITYVHKTIFNRPR